MTCYQRMHEVLLGVTRPEQPLDWDAILWDWMGVTDVHDRDLMLERMGVHPIDDYHLDVTPVDYVARAVVHLSLDARSRDRLFQLPHPNPPRSRW